jgi:hypothetical protein
MTNRCVAALGVVLVLGATAGSSAERHRDLRIVIETIDHSGRGRAPRWCGRCTMNAVIDATDVLADLRFARDVEALHRLGARALYEFLVELGRERLIRTDLEARTRQWGRLDRGILEAAGGDRLPTPPIHLVRQ